MIENSLEDMIWIEAKREDGTYRVPAGETNCSRRNPARCSVFSEI